MVHWGNSTDLSTVVAAQIINCAVDTVWDLIVTDEGRARWLMVRSTEPSLVAHSPFEWTARWATDRPMRFCGTVRSVEPRRRLVLDWLLDLSGRVSTLELRLASDDADRTTVVVRHTGFTDSDLGIFEHNGYAHYWVELLDGLAACVEGRAPNHHHEQILSGPHFAGGHPQLGLLVRAVALGSPAHAAGLRGGDVLHSVDGRPVRTIAEFDAWLCERSYGNHVTFGLWRGERSVELFPPPWDHHWPQLTADQR